MSDAVQRGIRLVRGIQTAIRATGFDQQTTEVVAHAPAESRSVTLGGKVQPPRAFVSWAHTHSSWTKEQTTAWESQVAEFAASLRHLGINADVDLFHLDEREDWTRYGPTQVQNAKFTLVVMSESWAERWDGTNSPHEGAGAAAEADNLKGMFAVNQADFQRRVVLVMFPDVGVETVPRSLNRVARVAVDPADLDSYELLIRMLTEQPRYPKPPIGEIPIFNAVGSDAPPTTLAVLRNRLTQIEKRKNELTVDTSGAAEEEREQLHLSEAATRGFIDAQLINEP